MIGMLLMTLGLKNAVALFPPAAWKTAVEERLKQIQNDAHLREQMLLNARQAAVFIKEFFETERVALYGDYFSRPPINFWSRASLCYWTRQKTIKNWHEAYEAIKKECGDAVDFTEYESLTESERKSVDETCLML